MLTIRKYKGNVYQQFLSKIAGEYAKIAKFSSSVLEANLKKILRKPGVKAKNWFAHSNTSINKLKIIDRLDSLIITTENAENAQSLRAHKEFKGKSLKEIYRNLF